MKDIVLETNGLILRKFNIFDAEDMFYNWANDEEVTKYMTWNPHVDIEQTKIILNYWINEYKENNAIRFAIVEKASNQVIGSIDVVDFINDNPEVGYCLSRKHWNKGYMKEALSRFISYLFNDLGFSKIVIEADERNIASNKVIEHSGFTFLYKEYKKECSMFKKYPITVNWYELNK